MLWRKVVERADGGATEGGEIGWGRWVRSSKSGYPILKECLSFESSENEFD